MESHDGGARWLPAPGLGEGSAEAGQRAGDRSQFDGARQRGGSTTSTAQSWSAKKGGRARERGASARRSWPFQTTLRSLSPARSLVLPRVTVACYTQRGGPGCRRGAPATWRRPRVRLCPARPLSGTPSDRKDRPQMPTLAPGSEVDTGCGPTGVAGKSAHRCLFLNVRWCPRTPTIPPVVAFCTPGTSSFLDRR